MFTSLNIHSAALDAFLELCRSYQEADVEVPAEYK